MKNTDTISMALELASKDPRKVNDFYHTLFESDIYVITQDDEKRHGERVLEEETNMAIVQIQNQDNQTVFPIFSSTENIAKITNQAVSYCRLSFQVFLKAINFAPCVLNPNSQYSTEFTTAELKSAFDQLTSINTTEHTAKAGEQIFIGQPEIYPEKLVEILKQCFKKHPKISEGYLAQFYLKEDSAGAHPLIAIKTSGDFNAFVNEASKEIQRVLGSKEIVDFIDLSQDDELSDYFKEIPPFYKKGNRLFNAVKGVFR